MNKTKFFGAALLAIVLYSCGPKPVSVTPLAPANPIPPEVVVAPKNTSSAALVADVAEGKSLCENNCAKCHKLFGPLERTKEEWTPILARMQKKAKLDDEQIAKIYAYLTNDMK